MTDYAVVASRSTAGDFHARIVPDPARPEIWVHDVTQPALVLGSTQSDEVVDRAEAARRGVEIVRRRSGGGAVYLAPGDVVWVDVILPAGSPGWADDVHAPMVWLGQHLRDALATELVSVAAGDELSVHTARLQTTPWSDLVCFDGVGPGEVVTTTGAKLVGISQRRTRAAARLQACWYVRHDPDDLVGLLVPGRDGRLDARALRPVAVVPPAVARRVPQRLATLLRA
jgi:lipoate-protein ligase A